MLKLHKYKVAITPIFDPDQTASGLYIPDTAKERTDQGIVKYVGSGVTKERFGFQPGDMVLYPGYSGTLLSLEGEGLYIITHADFITATIENPIKHISGLYVQLGNGTYAVASYQTVIELINKVIREQDWFMWSAIKSRGFNVDSKQEVKTEDYAKIHDKDVDERFGDEV